MISTRYVWAACVVLADLWLERFESPERACRWMREAAAADPTDAGIFERAYPVGGISVFRCGNIFLGAEKLTIFRTAVSVTSIIVD